MSHLLFAYYLCNDIRSFQNLLKQDDSKVKEPRKGFSEKSGQKLRINQKDRYGRTVLHIAVSENKNSFVRSLLQHKGIDVFVQDEESGYTALHRAIYVGNLEAASLLLSKDPSFRSLRIKDKEGLSPFQFLSRVLSSTIHPVLDLPIIGNELYGFGTNVNNTLGIANGKEPSSPERVFLLKNQTESPTSGQLFSRDKILDVQASKFHSVVLTDEPSQNVYVCGIGAGGRIGFNTDVQYNFIPIPGIIHKVIQISVSHTHSLALTKFGSIYSWGKNGSGELGLSNDELKKDDPIQITPRRISAFKDYQIIGIAAGKSYSVAWTDTDIYSWGLNNGQLGISDHISVVSTPRRVAGLLSPVIHAVCTTRATICLLQNNSIIAFCNYNQVKLPFNVDFGSSLKVTKHPLSLTRFNVRKLLASENKLAVLTELGEVYEFDMKLLLDRDSTSSKNSTRTSFKFTPLWIFESSDLAALDIAWTADNSLILCTRNGTCWKRELRSKKREKSSSSPYSRGPYKYNRIENLQMVVGVRASASGSFFAIRNDYLPPPIYKPSNMLIDLLRSLLPYDHLLHVRQPRLIPPEDEDGVPIFDEDRAASSNEMQLLFEGSIPILTSYENYKQSFSDVTIYCGTSMFHSHKFILCARSSFLRKLLLQKKKSSVSNIIYIEEITQSHSTIRVEDIPPLAVAILLHYLYTDTLLSPWHLDSRFSPLKENLSKLANLLELPHLAEVLPFSVSRQPLLSLTNDILQLYNNFYVLCEETMDTVIKLKDGELKAHGLFLSLRSEYFSSYFQFVSMESNSFDIPITVNLSHLTVEHMSIVLRHVYSDLKVELFDDLKESDFHNWLETMFEILSIADELLFLELKSIAQQSLLRFLNLKTLPTLMDLSLSYHAEELYSRCIDYACHNIEFFLEANRISEWDGFHLKKVAQRLTELLSDQRVHLPSSKIANRLLIRDPVLMEKRNYELKVLREYLFSQESSQLWDDSPYRSIFEDRRCSTSAVILESGIVPSSNQSDSLNKEDAEKSPKPNVVNVTSITKTAGASVEIQNNIESASSGGDKTQLNGPGADQPVTATITFDKTSPWRNRENLSHNNNTTRASLRELLEQEKADASTTTVLSDSRFMKAPTKKSQREKKKELSKQVPISKTNVGHTDIELGKSNNSNPWSVATHQRGSFSSSTGVKKSFNGILREAAREEGSSQVIYQESKKRISNGSPTSWNLLTKPSPRSASLPKNSQPLSISEIMTEQKEEIESQKRRSSFRKTIEEIQQEEEFQKWWEEESLRVQKKLGILKTERDTSTNRKQGQASKQPQRRHRKEKDSKVSESTAEFKSLPIDIPRATHKKGKARAVK